MYFTFYPDDKSESVFISFQSPSLKNIPHLLRCHNYPDWSQVRPHEPWKFIVSKPRRIAVAMKKYEMESCQEEFPVTIANGKPRTFIRDSVTLSRFCFKPSSWRTAFTISRTVDQIRVKLCNSFAASRSFPIVSLSQSMILSFGTYPFV